MCVHVHCGYIGASLELSSPSRSTTVDHSISVQGISTIRTHMCGAICGNPFASNSTNGYANWYGTRPLVCTSSFCYCSSTHSHIHEFIRIYIYILYVSSFSRFCRASHVSFCFCRVRMCAEESRETNGYPTFLSFSFAHEIVCDFSSSSLLSWMPSTLHWNSNLTRFQAVTCIKYTDIGAHSFENEMKR